MPILRRVVLIEVSVARIWSVLAGTSFLLADNEQRFYINLFVATCHNPLSVFSHIRLASITMEEFWFLPIGLLHRTSL